jgi:uncharacterized membrane protein
MKKFHYVILAGISIIVLGITLVLLTTNQSAPPVDVLLDQSGLTSIDGVYFDQFFLHNHGSQNVTVVVVIENDLDNGPRMSDPVQICPGCTATALVEEHQPPQNADQTDVFTNIVLHPNYIRVEYLSILLATPITFNMLRQIAWLLIAAGLIVMTYGLRLSNSGRRKRTKRSKRSRNSKK